MDQVSIDQAVFELAYEFLLSYPQITKGIIEHYLSTPHNDHPQEMAKIYFRLVGSAQNAEMMPKVIGGSITGGIEKLGSVVLSDFNHIKVAKHYGNNSQALLDDIKQQLHPRGELRNSPQSKWPRFCKSVLSGAQFLTQFNSPQDFYEWCDFFDCDERARLALPLLISNELHGFGFALACDFLKGLG